MAEEKSYSEVLKLKEFPKYVWDTLFAILFICLSLIFQFDELMFRRPQGVHVWRQSDCTSITLNYYQNEVELLKPETHYRFNDKAQAIGEFPLLYFTVGQLYKVFGPHEWLYRLFWYLIAFLGSFCLFRLAFEILGLPIESLFIGLSLLASPVVAYYSINFVPDTPSLYITCVALYLLFKAYRSNSTLIYSAAIILCVLASLSKINAMMMPIILLFVFWLKDLMTKNWKRFAQISIGAVFILGINVLWYSYAIRINAENMTHYFTTGIAPIWNMTFDEIKNMAGIFFELRLREVYSKFLILFSLVIIAISLIQMRKKWQYIFFVVLAVVAGLSFLAMFFERLNYHDYYLINLCILLPVFLIIGLYGIKDKKWKIGWIYLLKFFFFFLLIKNIYHSTFYMNMRLDIVENEFYQERGYNDLERYLESIDVNKNDFVISIPDKSPNTTLYLMNRSGWSNLYHENLTRDDIEVMKTKGAKYLIIGDPNLMEDESIKPYCKEKIGQHQSISIFKL